MNNEKDSPIRIEQVGNGFIVFPDSNRQDPILKADTLVFQSMAELQMWLEVHFSHRSKAIKTDL